MKNRLSLSVSSYGFIWQTVSVIKWLFSTQSGHLECLSKGIIIIFLP